MRFEKLIFVMIIMTLGILSQVTANIIRVPADEQNLSDGLGSARNGDTVLVADGTYTGDDNVDLDIPIGVTLISVNGPAHCIIDAERGEGAIQGITLNDRSVLSGITVKRTTRELVVASGVGDWLVINCIFEQASYDEGDCAFKATGRDCDGTIKYCTFRSNNSGDDGGALIIASQAVVNVESCYFHDNSSDSTGGALYVSNGDGVIINCIFEDNSAGMHGGAISVVGGSEIEISFCNIVSNDAESWGGGVYRDSNGRPDIYNCIIWANNAFYGDQMACVFDEDNIFSIHHCVVQDGEDMDAGWFGDDLVEERVSFTGGRRPNWGPTNYYQRANSPAINMGSGTVEDLGMENYTTQTDLSPDANIADIGFHYDLDLYYKLGTIIGHVFDADTNEPIVGATVETSLGQSTRTVNQGFFRIDDALADTTFDITAKLSGYSDSTLFNVELLEGEEIDLNFSLLHPEFLISVEELVATADSADTGFVDFTISNEGNGILNFRSRLELTGDFNLEPWTLRNSVYVSDATDDNRIAGAVFADDKYFAVGRADDDPHWIYVFDQDGALLDTLPQFGSSRTGMSDLAYDGELLWGTEDDSVYGFTTDGELVSTWLGPLNIAKNIAYDNDRDVLWISYTTQDIFGWSRNGEEVIDSPLNRKGLRIYGLAYWSDDPDGYPLYITSRLSNDDTGYIYKMNPDNSDTMFVRSIAQIGAKPSGGFITSEMDPYSVTIMYVMDDATGDRINVYQLAGNTSWMSLSVDAGVVQPGSIQPVRMTLFNERFDYGTYNALMTIIHNGIDREIELPVVFHVVDPDFAPGNGAGLPEDFRIESTYPNPFNAEVSINFAVRNAGMVSLKVFDLAGREIAVISEDYLEAGHYRSVIDAGQWSAGVYLARLQAGDEVRIAKLACIK